MRINRNNVDIRMSPKGFCGSCAFLYRQIPPACILLRIRSHLPCGGEFTHTASEIFKL